MKYEMHLNVFDGKKEFIECMWKSIARNLWLTTVDKMYILFV